MIGIAALLIILIAPIFIYRKAKENGHNAILWTIAAYAIGIGLQIIIPTILIIAIGLVMMFSGSTEQEVGESIVGLSSVIGIVFMILSIVGVVWVVNRVSLIKDEPPFMPPPPPPDFN